MSNVNLNETAPTQFQDIGRVSLAYRHFGKEGAPPVVCFQHFTGTMNNFDPIQQPPGARPPSDPDRLSGFRSFGWRDAGLDPRYRGAMSSIRQGARPEGDRS